MAEPQPVEMSGQTIEQVQGDIVRLQQCGVQRLDAGQAQLVQSIAGRVEAEWVETQQTAAQIIEADTVRLRGSLALGVRAETIAAEQVGALAIRAEQATLADSNAGILIGENVQAGNVRTFLFVGRQVDGQVNTTFDSRSAALLGLAVGAALGVLSLIGGLLGRRR